MDKKIDFLEKQRREREELIKLKKMQSGQITAEAPEAVDTAPKTFKEKSENFWYYYRTFIIVGGVLAIAIAILVAQCVKKVDYDMEVVYFTHKMVLIAQLDETQEYFEKYAEDVNGDGKVNVLVVNCSIDPDGDDTVYRNNILSRMQTLLCADPKALVFITDSGSYEYLNTIDGDSHLFKTEPYALNENFYKNTATEKYGRLPEGLQISCRELEDTALESFSESTKYYPYAKKLVENFIKDNVD